MKAIRTPEPQPHFGRTARLAGLIITFGLVSALVAPAQTQDNGQAQQQRGGTGGRGGGAGGRGGGARGRGGFGGAVQGEYKSSITPHWLPGDAKFWYRNELKGGTSEFILVNAEAGKRDPAFDHKKLAAALAKATGNKYTGDKLPFSTISFVDNGAAVQFSAVEKTWKCDLSSYACTEVKSDASALLMPAISEETEVAQAELPVDEFAAPTDEPGATFLAPQQQQTGGGRAGGGGGRGGGRGGAATPGGAAAGFQDTSGGGGGGGGRGFGRGSRATSPDGKWTATVRDLNIYVTSTADNKETQLTTDGVQSDAYQGLSWAPNSEALVAWRVQPGDRKMIYWIQSSPEGGGRTVATELPYAQAGDKYAMAEINVFDMATMKQVKPATDRWTDGNYGSQSPPDLRWEKDQRHFTYEFPERGHQRWRLVEVDSKSGDVRNLIDEKSKDFIWTAHPDNGWTTSLVRWLTNTDELIYISEKDGWKQLYLVGLKEGTIKNQITKGEWVVRALDFIDEDNRQIWFQASGRNPGENPYNLHFYRVNFDGTGLTELTGGNGTHTVQYSPDYKYLIDTFSRVDVPPVHTLHRVSDGKEMCKLEETDISEMKARGWKPVTEFVAKGRDGVTDIYGTITWPRDFNPKKKYPVLENIYAGPQTTSVRQSFNAAGSGGGGGGGRGGPSYGDLGFILVQIDGMGTPHRSHAFHAVCWENLGRDNGFPDRILWHKAAGAKYPAYDITRVGIFGTSAGGQSAASAVIFHSDFYRAAVENSGCVDNRIDKSSWNEQWMGYMPPDKVWSKDPDNWYSQCSCIDQAGKLGGALLILVGEQDHNVPPESSLRLANALMLANKDFEMYYVPNAGHGIAVEPTAGSLPVASAFTARKTREFFERTLQAKVLPLDNSAKSRN